MTLTGFCDDNETKQRTKSRQLVPKWIPPLEAFLKFNVDGTLAQSGDKGVVGQDEARDSNDEAYVLAKSVCKLAPEPYVWLLGCPEILHITQNIVNN